MGLAAVYGTVKNHKGSINVFSKSGQGSVFKVHLPLLDNIEEKINEIVRASKVKKGTARILVVDDETILLNLLSDTLRSLGYKVITSKDGAEALEHYKKSWEHIDLVILDMIMPELGGHDTFIEMRKINPAIKVLLSSGYGIDGEAQEILDEGVLDFIQKPYQKLDLSEKVAEALQCKASY